MPKPKLEIHTIEYTTVDDQLVLGRWLDRAARDAVWDAIQAIPFKAMPGYIGYEDYEERTVVFDYGPGRQPPEITDHPVRHGVHGRLNRYTHPLDAPLGVRDGTERD